MTSAARNKRQPANHITMQPEHCRSYRPSRKAWLSLAGLWLGSALAVSGITISQAETTAPAATSGTATASSTEASRPKPKASSGTTIIGTQESPTVLNVVPWQSVELRPSAWDGKPSPARSVLDDSLQPVDRDVLRREIDYFNLLRDSAQSEQTATE